MSDNRAAYETPYAVGEYARWAALLPSEERILAEIAPQLSGADMLDIGVGGGRTTLHFGPRVARYTGVDYAAPMIEAARARFQGKPYRFDVADGRDLPFDDASFDLVLFSFNGIDSVGHEDRLKILAEMRRVVRRSGEVIFSTHNLAAARRVLSRKPTLDPRLMLRRWRLRKLNPPLSEILPRPWAVLRDGALRETLALYYVKPSEQLRQLAEHGLEVTAVYAMDGAIVKLTDDLPDFWLYYRCRIV